MLSTLLMAMCVGCKLTGADRASMPTQTERQSATDMQYIIIPKHEACLKG